MPRKNRSIVAVETNLLEHHTYIWIKSNNILDSYAIEAPAELDSKGRYSRKRVMFHRHSRHRDNHHPPRNTDRYYFCTNNKLRTQYDELA
jgi:hypothetical protein